MLDVPPHRARAFAADYSESPNGWLRRQLALLVEVPQVLVDRGHRHPEQLRDQRLAQPERLVGWDEAGEGE